MNGNHPIARLRRMIGAAGFVLLIGVAGLTLDWTFPPDLSRLTESSSMVLDSENRLLRAFTTGDGTWRLHARPDQVDPLYLRMVLTYEDRRFRMHPGVDPLAAARALGQMAVNGRIVSGASTITMQTARLLEPRPRTLVGKFAETLRALQLEGRHAKDDILAMYLTLAPFGGNLEGVRAASLAYFGKEPARLTPGEAALLVALPQSPTRLRPDRFPGRAKVARDRILGLMQRGGVLTPQQASEARGEPLPRARRPLPFRAPHLARMLTSQEPAAPVHRTTIDGTLQATLETVIRREHAGADPRATIAALVVENATRRVVAYLGSGDFFDGARSGQVDMAQAVRSPGSALKPFIYGMAFDEKLIHPETIIVDQPTRFGEYRPENFRRVYRGEVTVREALQQSLNIPAVSVLERIGPGRFVARLRTAGITLRYAGGAKPGLPLALGGGGVTLLDLVSLYTALANGGEAAPLTMARREGDGAPARKSTRLTGATAAWYLSRIMEAAPPPDGFLAAKHNNRPRPIAFKTGTSYGFRDAWAVGYDDAHTVGIWVGRPDGTPSPGRYGRITAAPLLFRVFGLLPGQGGRPNANRPDTAIVVRNAALPERLQRFAAGPKNRNEFARALTRRLTITFPPDGAVVPLERTNDGLAALPLTAEGGSIPFNWLVNGHAIPSSPHRRGAFWQPDGKGFVRITVIDATGRTAQAEALMK